MDFAFIFELSNGCGSPLNNSLGPKGVEHEVHLN